MPSAISKVYVQPQLTDTQTHGLYSFFPYIMHEKQMMLPGEERVKWKKWTVVSITHFAVIWGCTSR